MPHSYTADQPMAPQGKNTEHLQPRDNRKVIKYLSEIIAKLKWRLVLDYKDQAQKTQYGDLWNLYCLRTNSIANILNRMTAYGKLLSYTTAWQLS